MSEHEENINSIEEETKKITKELPLDEINEKLEFKIAMLEKVIKSLQQNLPKIIKVSRPIHLNIIHKNFLYQLIIPEHALSKLENFSDSHSVISKFGAMLSQLENEAQQQSEQIEEQKLKEEKK